MPISHESIKKFQEIFKKRFGFELSEKEAEKQATKLLNLFKLIYLKD